MESIQEVVWCNHLQGHSVPFMAGRSALLCDFRRSFWAVVEENKLKMVCQECWSRSSVKLVC